MTDKYLAFASESEANNVLYTLEPTEWDNTGEEPVPTAWEPRPNYRNIDTIGIIYKPTGEMLQGEESQSDGDAAGGDGEYPEMAPIEGWHVNVRLVDGEDADALEPFVVQPKTPVRVWG
jgi:hypothetical protein